MKEKLKRIWADNMDVQLTLVLLFILLTYCLVSEGK